MKSVYFTVLAGSLGASLPFYHLSRQEAPVIIAGEPRGTMAALVSVVDGDTLEIAMNGHELRVRLDGIDAPEAGQPSGKEAAEALAAQVKNRPLKLVFTGRDEDGVALTRIQVRGADVAEKMLRDGWGWCREDRDHEIDCALLADAEAEAQLYRRGLWVGQIPVRPWEWRQQATGPAKVIAHSASRAGALQR